MNKKIIIYIVAILLVVSTVIFLLKIRSASPHPLNIETEKIGRADINNTVTATGTLEASVTVEVGTQVSGRINKMYVDYNSIVKKGQLLALLDTETLKSTLESSKASLDMAYAEFEFQKAKYQRNKILIEKKLISRKDFDEIEYAYKSATANLNSAKARYAKDKTNLGYAYIYSPINGIVLEKNIEEGETVAASFETPTLFTIANDLKQMKIEADVDEADIGQVKTGQRIEFSVDAFPDLVFHGKVVELHLMPVKNANVITYTVIINAPNPEQILMPGMTTNVTFFVTEKKNILAVPNRAFEFKPDITLLEACGKMGLTLQYKPEFSSKKHDLERIVWIMEGDSIFKRKLKLGATDEINYEVLYGIEEGTEVIISMTTQLPDNNKKEKTPGKSPFMPTPSGRNKK